MIKLNIPPCRRGCLPAGTMLILSLVKAALTLSAEENIINKWRVKLPEISKFFGIKIYMYYREHAPPHFHAEHGEYEIKFEIDSGVVEGRFPKSALSAVIKWFNLHKDELTLNWVLAEKREPLNRIKPLE